MRLQPRCIAVCCRDYGVVAFLYPGVASLQIRRRCSGAVTRAAVTFVVPPRISASEKAAEALRALAHAEQVLTSDAVSE
jgi:hypothetical protein